MTNSLLQLLVTSGMAARIGSPMVRGSSKVTFFLLFIAAAARRLVMFYPANIFACVSRPDKEPVKGCTFPARREYNVVNSPLASLKADGLRRSSGQWKIYKVDVAGNAFLFWMRKRLLPSGAVHLEFITEHI